MSDIFSAVQEFDLLTVFYRIFLAFLIGGLIGIERGKHGRAAGLRTHVLVCVGAALAALLGIYMQQANPAGVVDPTRIAAQVIASIGVIGAGSILIKNRDIITGLTTSAGMWSTGIIGLSIGFGFYEGALICALITIIAMSMLNYLETTKKNEIRLYVEIDEVKKTNEVIKDIKEIDNNISVFYVGPSKINIEGDVGIYIKLHVKKKENINQSLEEVISKLLKINHVVLAIRE